VSIATLDLALADAQRILLDSSALIAYHSPAESTHSLVKHIMKRIEDGGDCLCGFLSVVTAAEMLVRPLKAGPAQLTFMHTFLKTYPNLTILPVDLEVALQAATLRATTGLPMPDALVIASALLAGCDSIITNDSQWRRRLSPLFKDFRWVCLGSHVD
jgi:predicted nucleic acid-binding protein